MSIKHNIVVSIKKEHNIKQLYWLPITIAVLPKASNIDHRKSMLRRPCCNVDQNELRLRNNRPNEAGNFTTRSLWSLRSTFNSLWVCLQLLSSRNNSISCDKIMHSRNSLFDEMDFIHEDEKRFMRNSWIKIFCFYVGTACVTLKKMMHKVPRQSEGRNMHSIIHWCVHI